MKLRRQYITGLCEPFYRNIFNLLTATGRKLLLYSLAHLAHPLEEPPDVIRIFLPSPLVRALHDPVFQLRYGQGLVSPISGEAIRPVNQILGERCA